MKFPWKMFVFFLATYQAVYWGGWLIGHYAATH